MFFEIRTNFEKYAKALELAQSRGIEGSKGKKKLLEDIKNEFNAYLAEKELDPIIFGVHFKVLAITTRG